MQNWKETERAHVTAMECNQQEVNFWRFDVVYAKFQIPMKSYNFTNSRFVTDHHFTNSFQMPSERLTISLTI